MPFSRSILANNNSVDLFPFDRIADIIRDRWGVGGSSCNLRFADETFFGACFAAEQPHKTNYQIFLRLLRPCQTSLLQVNADPTRVRKSQHNAQKATKEKARLSQRPESALTRVISANSA